MTAGEQGVVAALLDQLSGLEELANLEQWPTVRVSRRTVARWRAMLGELVPRPVETAETIHCPCTPYHRSPTHASLEHCVRALGRRVEEYVAHPMQERAAGSLPVGSLTFEVMMRNTNWWRGLQCVYAGCRELGTVRGYCEGHAP